MTLAIVFPGQGSQSLAMQAELADQYPGVKEVYALASERLGYDLWQLIQDGPDERLNETVVTQPAMLTAGMAAYSAWQSEGGPPPSTVAGHSLGEFSALVCAGSIDLSDAVDLVKLRAEFMQSAVPGNAGAMAALLGLDDDVVIDVCANSAQGQVVSAVNFNAPGQVVIAGDKAAVQRATDAAKEAGAKRAIMLSVSVPSHCSLMLPAAEKMAEALASVDIRTPEIPVIGNADVAPYENPDHVRDGLRRQLFSPVRWVDTVNYFVSNGTTVMIESGPGKVLAGLARRIDRSLAAGFIDSPDSLSKAIETAGQ